MIINRLPNIARYMHVRDLIGWRLEFTADIEFRVDRKAIATKRVVIVDLAQSLTSDGDQLVVRDTEAGGLTRVVPLTALRRITRVEES